MADPSAPPSARGGPRTPEGKARAAQNALRHGLRAGRFVLLPHEDPEAFQELVAALRARHRPADPVERELVDAIAVAMWREARADRLEAEALADVPPADETRTCGSDLSAAAARASLATIVRYRTAAQLEHRRALLLLEQHRRIVAAADARRAEAAGEAAEPPGASPEAEREGPEQAAPVATRGAGVAPAESDPPPRPERVSLRLEERAKRNPLDTPLLRRLGRDPDLVLPVPGLEPRLWPKAQERAVTGPFPPGGPQPYRRVPGLPWDQWWSHQHLLDPAPAAEPTPAASTAAPHPTGAPTSAAARAA